MRITFMVLLLSCGWSAFSQTVHPFKMEVTASLAGRDLLPVIFQKVDDNTIFTAAIENRRGTSDTIFVALLDSCGNEKVSKRLVSKYTITDAKTFSVHSTRNGYILVISYHYQRLLFLDKDLNFLSTRNILRFKDPVFVPCDTLLMLYNKDPVTNSVSSLVSVHADWKKRANRNFSMEGHTKAITCDENGGTYCVGSYFDGDSSHFYVAKFDKDGRRFREAYALDQYFMASEILVRKNEIVVLGIGPNSGFASLYFNQFGELVAQKFYDLNVDQIFKSKYRSESLHGGLAISSSGEYLFYAIDVNREMRFYKMELTVYENRLINAGWGLQGASYDVGKTMRVAGVAQGEGVNYCGVSKEIKTVVKSDYSISSGKYAPINYDFGSYWNSGPFPAKQATMTQKVNWKVKNECPGVLKRNFPFIDTVLCNSDSLKLTSRITRGTPAWNIGDTAKSITVDTSGIYVAKYNQGLCGAIDYQRVRFLDSAEFGRLGDSSICGIDTFDFDLPPDLVYSWQFPNGTKTFSPKVFPKESGSYVLNILGVTCFADTIEIGVYEFPEARASPDGALCRGDTVTLQGDGGETYLWTPADFLNDDRLENPKAFPPNTQLYRVVVTSKEGCHDTDFVNLEVHPRVKARFSPCSFSIPVSVENVQFTNRSSPADQYTWIVNGKEVSTGKDFQFDVKDTGLYNIKLLGENETGCNDSFEQQVHILALSFIHIPNAFTPNGDGINETFAPSVFYFADYEMTIFNRWGQRIWKSRKGETFPVWDATTDQSIETVPVGTYQYIIKGTDKEGQKHEYVGKVHVVR